MIITIYLQTKKNNKVKSLRETKKNQFNKKKLNEDENQGEYLN